MYRKYEKYITRGEQIAHDALDVLSEKERKELKKWIENKEENAIIYHDLLEGNIGGEDREKIIGKFRKEQAWKRVRNHIESEKKVAKRNVLRKFRIPMAAAVLLALVTFAYFQFINSASTFPETASLNPGTSRANLSLPERSIALHNTDAKQNISSSYHVENGTLIYEKGTDVEQHKIDVPRGGEYKVQLADGSKIWLNAGSSLSYPTNFNGDTREVTFSGEGYFEVAGNTDKPFIIHTNDIQVKVLGTAFNISAYEDDDFVHTTLEEGKVVISKEKGSDKNTWVLYPGQQAYYNTLEQQLMVSKVKVQEFTSWKTGRLIFSGETLGSLFKKFSRWYDVDVVFEDEKLAQKTFTGSVPRFEDGNHLLKILEKTHSVKLDIQGKTIIVGRK